MQCHCIVVTSKVEEEKNPPKQHVFVVVSVSTNPFGKYRNIEDSYILRVVLVIIMEFRWFVGRIL